MRRARRRGGDVRFRRALPRPRPPEVARSRGGASPERSRRPALLLSPDFAMSAQPPERRSAGNEPLRDAFEELLVSLEQRQGDAVMHVALRACAERARASGMPPERFVATLKRVLASRP